MENDFLLIRRMKSGDDTAIETFVRKYYPSILRYCYLHMKDKNYAEDVTQEVFARFFRTLNQYQHYGKAQNYLYVIAANICRDYYRKPNVLQIDNLEDQPIYEMDSTDLRIDIRQALEKLPVEIRDVTILYFFQNVKQKEIAKILGIGLPLVKYRIKRAKKLLANYLGEEETM